MLGAYAAFTVFAMAITPVEVVLVRGTLHAGSAALGVVLGAWGVGMIAGGALVGRIRRRVGLPALLIGAAVAEAAAFLGMGLSPSVAGVVAFSALGGVGNGLEGVLFMTAVQERVSDAYQARVSGLMEALLTTAVGVGFLTGGTIAALTGARAAYVTAGLGGLAVVGWTLARLRGHAKPEPALAALAPA
jgi:predicted MFS family arabinose efflux permease